jgi:hypothetical protein
MASKSEVLALVLEACAAHNAKAPLVEAITEILKPKTAGASINLDEVTQKDSNGDVTHIMCALSGKFLPATAEFFYEDKDGKGINGLKRLSRQGEAIRKSHARNIAISEKAIVSDILDGVISNEDGKAKIEALRASKPDYSTVSDVLPVAE